MIKLIQGDCLDKMKDIPDSSIDLILTDSPYGSTSCKWDVIIPFEPMWKHLKRIIKPNRAIVLFGQEPYSSLLRTSNISWFKYDWYWKKSRPSGFVNAKLKPLKDIEIISVFSSGTTANRSKTNMIYFPQGLKKINKKWSRPKLYESGEGVNPTRKSHTLKRIIEYENYPRQILEYKNHNKNQLHPTQKPVALMEYFIKTYSNEGETLLDFTMGSFTTAIACLNLKRNFVGIELEDNYFKVGKQRVKEHLKTLNYKPKIIYS